MALHVGQRGPGHQARVGGSGGGGSGPGPDPFDLGDETAAALSATYESATIIVAGLGGPVGLSVAGGHYAINGGGWASTATTVTNGDTVKVRGVSSGSVATAADVALTIGGLSDTFTITTVANSETSALVARFTTDPGAARRGQIDAAIGALKGAGLWSKIDVLQVYAAHDSQAAALNWKGSSFTATPAGAPTFTADRGYEGDGIGAYVDTGFANTTAAANWQASSGLATYAVGVNLGGTVGASNYVFGLAGAAASVRFNPFNGTGGSGRFLQSSDQNFTNAAGRTGRYLVTRDASGQTGYRNGAAMSSPAVGTLSVASANLAALRTNTAFSDSRVSFVMIGGGAAIWTATEAGDFDAAMSGYLTAVGAN